MNLNKCNGKVPVYTEIGDTPYRLVDFPTREVFDNLFRLSPPTNRANYYKMLKTRAEGATLADSGRPFGMGRERARQIEAKFIRLMSLAYAKESV